MSESRAQKAIRLLKQDPFEFVDHGKFQGAMPKDFKPELGDDDWDKATAVMAVLRSKPAIWQWNQARVRAEGRLSDRVVRRGIAKLKREGWIHHVNVYDDERKSLAVFIAVFNSPIPKKQRRSRSRFAMIHTENGWVFGYPGDRYFLHEGITKKKGDPSVHPPYEHISTVEMVPQTPKGADADSLVSEREIPASNTDDSPPPATQDPPLPPESATDEHNRLTRELERLGKKQSESEEDLLEYEEFVAHTLLPAIDLPPVPEANDRPRRKIWNLHWIERSLLGAVLLKLSSSPKWDLNSARRVVKRLNEGYITKEDLRLLLFTFDWRSYWQDRKTLEAMTFYGRVDDAVSGGIKVKDNWKNWVRSSNEDYKWEHLGMLGEHKARLFPREDRSVDEETRDRVMDFMREICTGERIIGDDFLDDDPVAEESAVAFILSRHRRTEKTQRNIDENREKLLKWFAHRLCGILVFQKNIHVLEETTGITPEEVKKEHRKQVDLLHRRLVCHGKSVQEIYPLI